MPCRLQRLVDRAFCRDRYDAAATPAAFGAVARREVELTVLAEEPGAVVGRTLQPAHVSLWLREPQATTAPEDVSETLLR